MLDTLLGRYLGTLGVTQEAVSLAYAIYGIFQLLASVILLLLQCWKPIACISMHRQFLTVLLVVAAAFGSTFLMVFWPASYQLLLTARALQGSFGAVYSIYARALLARGFPLEWQMQAIAFMTAGRVINQ
jgi:MFS family permease